jgi:hypothetical protein
MENSATSFYKETSRLLVFSKSEKYPPRALKGRAPLHGLMLTENNFAPSSFLLPLCEKTFSLQRHIRLDMK